MGGYAILCQRDKEWPRLSTTAGSRDLKEAKERSMWISRAALSNRNIMETTKVILNFLVVTVQK